MRSAALGKRYEHDGSSLFPLSPLQRTTRDAIANKIERGDYKTETLATCICGAARFELLSTSDRYGQKYSVVICKECGLIQSNPRMDREAYERFFKDDYRSLYVGVEAATESFFDGERERGKSILAFLDRAKVLSGAAASGFVFEVGCGAGGCLVPFKDRGFRVAGSDFGEAYLTYGRSRGLDLRVGSLEEMDLSPRPTILLYSHVLHHVLDLEREIKKMHDVLADDGLVFVALPGVKNLAKPYQMDFLQLLQNSNTYHFTRTTLENVMRRFGFDLVRGDESIMAVFRKSTPRPSSTFVSDYAPVMSYLRRMERLRPFYSFTPQGLRIRASKARAWLRSRLRAS